MRRPAALALAALLLWSVPEPAAAKGPDAADAHARGLEFLAAQGGEGPYPAGLAAYAVEAADAAGLDAASWPEPSRAALDAVAVPAEGAPLLELVRPAYAAALAGRLRDWRGEDLEARLRAGYDGTQFGDPALLNDDLYAGLALVAAGAGLADPDLRQSLGFLLASQGADGGWGYAVDGPSLVDTTAMALLLLQRAGAAADASFGPVLDHGIAFILSAQDPATSGFAETPGGEPNCDSTAWALRVDLRGRGAAGWDYLLGLQGEDGGFSYRPGQPSNALCTVEAVTALGDALQGRAALSPAGSSSSAGPSQAAVAVAAALLCAAWGARRFRRI